VQEEKQTVAPKGQQFTTPPQGGCISPIDTVEKAVERIRRELNLLKLAREPIGLDFVLSTLSSTIKADDRNKLILFLCFLLNYTEEDQQNISFNAPSSTGKSYLALEIAKYFPPEDVKLHSYTSPTAFFHELGKLSTTDGKPLKELNGYIEDGLIEWEELERLKTLSGIGSDLRVIWTPSINNPLSGEVLGDLKVYDHNEERALRTLRHEFLDFYISQAVEPYKIVANSLIKLINLDAYKRKERIVEALGRLFEGEVRD
jgi:hypothetical protein